MKKHILIIGGNEEIYQIAQKYKLFLSVIRNNKISTSNIDKLYVINNHKEEDYIDLAQKIHSELAIDFVYSFEEEGNLIAAKIKEYLNIDGNNILPVTLTKNKDLMRDFLNTHEDFKIPYSKIFSINDIEKFIEKVGFPIIIKPSNSSGSRHIYKINEDTNYCNIFNKIKNEISDCNIIAEKFLEGTEISVEAMSLGGVHKIISITDKVTTGEPYFVELKHTIPSQLPINLQKIIIKKCVSFLDLINNRNGPTHTEMIISDQIPYIIESHNRVGGDYIQNMIEDVYNFNFYENLFKYVSTNKIENIQLKQKAVTVNKYVTLNPGYVDDIQGMDKTKSSKGIIKFGLNFKLYDTLSLPTCSNQRHLFIISKAQNVDLANIYINDALKYLSININNND